MSTFLIIRASVRSSVRQFGNSFPKVDDKMILLMASAPLLLLVWYDHLMLDQPLFFENH